MTSLSRVDNRESRRQIEMSRMPREHFGPPPRVLAPKSTCRASPMADRGPSDALG